MIEAGTITFRFGQRNPAFPGRYVASAEGGSTGLAARLFPYDFHFLSLLDRNGRNPDRFHANESDKDGTTVTTNTFTPAGVRVAEVKTPRRTGVSATRTRDRPLPGVLDLFSSLLFVRSQTLHQGETTVFVSHPVGSAHLVTVRSLGRDVLDGRKAIRLSVSIERIQGDLSLKPYTKMKDATLWLSDDEHRIPLELRTRVFIGDVRMRLTSWKVEG